MLITDKTFAADASKEEASGAAPRGQSAPHPHCGLYCVYTGLELTNQEVDFRELVKPEYIGSSKGSSMAELKDAAEDHGLYVVPANRLSSRELRNSPYPIILHVKSSLETQEYDHYELFLGTETGKAKLFNPPDPIKLVPFSKLAPRWDGNGLVVSAEPVDLDRVFGPGRKRLVLYMSVAIASIFALHLAKRRLPEAMLNSRGKLFGLSIGQGAAFAIAALLCGMVYHFANDAGLLANADATAAIQQVHAGNFIPKIGERKVHRLLDSDTVFIDARFARDYKAGHLEEAISVPVDANDVELQKATTDIAKDARIVLYCQSAACKFAEKVAIRLIEDGYSNISIFKGGWAEWTARNGRPKEAAI
jgi:rhodanese-related sulfurtransferase